MQGLTRLKDMYPWPIECPDFPRNLTGWFCGENMRMLENAIKETGAQVVLELGSWLGLSTDFLCKQVTKTGGVVIAIDHWKGSSEHQVVPEWKAVLPTLYETFLVNLWKFRDICIPVRETTLEGMRLIHSLGIEPDVIYVDASHEEEFVIQDVGTALDLFPKAKIIGDDFTWESIQKALEVVCPLFGCTYKSDVTCYEIVR